MTKCTELHDVLLERGSNYGPFDKHALITQKLKAVIAEGRGKERPFNAYAAEALEMICHKIGRIVNGNAEYADSWVDIAGYATLVAEIIKEQGESK